MERPRFNVLVTEDRAHGPEYWTIQLARLLEPQGVTTFVARSGREAVALAGRESLHAAVIDLNIPMEGSASEAKRGVATEPLWVLELMRRLPERPPVVAVLHPSLARREQERLIREALRLGVYSVLTKPIGVEDLLPVFKSLVDRRYRGAWPGADSGMGPGWAGRADDRRPRRWGRSAGRDDDSAGPETRGPAAPL
jgi:CheY-like chemotaxis protein